MLRRLPRNFGCRRTGDPAPYPAAMEKLRCLLLLALVLAGPALAQPMHRCVGEHGEPTFSDKRCGHPSATQKRSRAPLHGNANPGSYQTCLTRPADLRDALAAALQRDQRVRMSGLLLWSSGAAGPGMQRLQGLANHAVHDLQLHWDEDGQPTIVVDSTANPQGVPRAERAVFRLLTSRGCWWLGGD